MEHDYVPMSRGEREEFMATLHGTRHGLMLDIAELYSPLRPRAKRFWCPASLLDWLEFMYRVPDARLVCTCMHCQANRQSLF